MSWNSREPLRDGDDGRTRPRSSYSRNTNERDERFSPYSRPRQPNSNDPHIRPSDHSTPSLSVEPIDRFQVRCAAYQQPTEVAYFSYDGERKLNMMSDKELNWYYEPDLKTGDLSEGFPDRYITREPIPERLDALLESLQYVNSKVEGDAPKLRPDFCTWRGIMTKVLCAPYSRDKWELGVTLYNGTIYMEEHEKRKDLYGSTDKDKLMSYMGYKFESLATIPVPPSKLSGLDDELLAKRKEGFVNTNIQFCSVFKTKVGYNSIVMGAEVDCLVADSRPQKNPQSAYAELKTNRVITNPNQQKSFERHKLLKIWAQSFLPGIPTIIIGYRQDSGALSHIERRKTLDIPRSVRGTQPGIWDATVCINFADAFLKWVKTFVVEDDPKVVYTIEFDGRAIRLLRVDKGVEGVEGCFIPDWYLAK